MKLPTLYKRTSTGAIQQWAIHTDGATIETTWGQYLGGMQVGRDVIREGKNIGKANATTPAQQAEAEAQSQWEKKLKKGYVQSLEDAKAGKVDAVIEGGVEPMLAHRYDEQGHKIVWPAIGQPKLDGHRCIAIINGDEDVTLWSRTRKPITGLPHIERQLAQLRLYDGSSLILDGELYVHSHRDNFEALTSFIRSPNPKEGHEVLEYHVYDVANYSVASADLPYAERYKLLESLELHKHPNLKLVEARTVQDEDELMIAFEAFSDQGYEGLMVRNAQSKYVNKRSYDLQKVKEFSDSEFLVTGVEEGRGKLAGHAIFVCTTPDGGAFKAKMKGETSALKKFFDDPTLAVGRWLTVKYQGLTGKAKVPRFPVALRFREDV